MLKSNIKMLFEKLNVKRQGQLTFSSSIMKKMNTLPNETTYITPRCAMHLHDHWNKMVIFMNPSIFVDFSNGV